MSAPISGRYAASLQGVPRKLQVATLCEVRNQGSLIATLNVEYQSTVTGDRSSAIRRICTMYLTDPNAGTANALVQSTIDSVLSPYGNELFPQFGITYSDGSSETVPLGVFGIEDVTVDDSAGDLVITVNGNDRSRPVQRAGFTDIYTIAPSSNIGTAISDLLMSLPVGNPMPLNFDTTSYVTGNSPTVCKPGDDPWQICTDLAASIGNQLYFDRDGVCRFRATPDPTQASVNWAYDEGITNIATQMRRVLSRATTANYIIRDGEGTGNDVPVRGTAIDTGSNSPTRYGGPFGRVVDWKASPLYATTGAAQAAADADLALSIGGVESLELTAVPKPDHDIDDVIEITRGRSGLTQNRYVIDAYTLSFGASATMSLRTRRVA